MATEIALFKPPEALTETPPHYCPGCTDGILERIIAEVVDELGIRERTVVAVGIGCTQRCFRYFNLDAVLGAHGRAPSIATGIKHVNPETIVFTLQGDGDLGAIGIAEAVHTANRGENITVFCMNNTVYGNTGAQMAPTTLPGQRTPTTTAGRQTDAHGHPLKMAELIASLPGSAYVARTSLHNPQQIVRSKNAIRKAFLTQMRGGGFSFVEFLSACPTGWWMNPNEALKWIETELTKYYPLGVMRET